MKTSWNKLGFLAIATLAMLAGCDDLRTPTATAPEEALRASAAAVSSSQVQLLRASASPSVAQGVVDFRGGYLRAGDHSITIPALAVLRPTLFRIEVLDNGFIEVDLRAYERDATGAWTVDVGPAGFRKPIKLVLSYAGAENADDAAPFIVYAPNGALGGGYVRQPGNADPRNRWITGYLSHFSLYLGASGRTEE